MSEWKEYRLGDFMEFNPKISLPKDTIARKIAMDQLIPHTRDIYSWTYEPYSGGAKFQNGDTIMARITPCLENGKHAFISLLDDNEIAFGSTEFIVIRGRKDISDNSFVYYLSKYPSFKEAAIKSMVGSSGRQRAQVDVLENLSMKLPALPEQTLIASFLSSFDDKIAVNKKIYENLEAQAQALFKHWFVDFAPFKDGRFVESELGLIPEGWRVGTLGDIIVEIESGSRPKGGAEVDGIPSIGAEKIERFGYYEYSGEKYINTEYYNNMKRGHVKNGDVLLYKDGAYTGKTSMALDGFPYDKCAVNEHVFLLRTKFSKHQFFLYYLMSYHAICKMVQTLASAKAAQPGLNQKELLGINSIIPEERIIKQFNDLLSPIMHMIATNAHESQRLATLRDTLLPKLMSGDLKIDNL